MKPRLTHLFLALFLLALILLIRTAYLSLNQPRDTLPEFILGRWVGEFSEVVDGKTVPVMYQVEFLQGDQVVIGKKTPKHTTRNYLADYAFIQENRIRLEARMGDEWDLLQDKETLIITTRGYGLVNSGKYQRAVSYDWGALAFMIGLGIIWLWRLDLTAPYKRMLSWEKATTLSQSTQLQRILYTLLELLIFFAGLFLGHNVQQVPIAREWQVIRLPWDGMIIAELAALPFIAGMKLQMYQKKLPMPLNLVVVFLLGCSTYYLLIGLLFVTAWLFFGNYPSG